MKMTVEYEMFRTWLDDWIDKQYKRLVEVPDSVWGAYVRLNDMVLRVKYEQRECEKMEAKKNKYYEWHDLRKDSKDLPSENKIVNIVWVNRNPVSYYENIKGKPFLASALYYGGKWWWWSVVAEDLLAEYGKSPADKMDDAIEVIAWKYIEPFNEAEE